MASHRYAAFLRGINVGGSNVIRMADLRKALEAVGCLDVATVLASGNVVFASPDADEAGARERVERALEAVSGRRIAALVRTLEHLRALVARDPFRAVEVTPETRLYVSFLAEPRATGLTIPYSTADGAFTLLELTDTELLSVVVLKDGVGTLDAMGIIEKEFGKEVTMRNWNTVQKVVARAQQ